MEHKSFFCQVFPKTCAARLLFTAKSLRSTFLGGLVAQSTLPAVPADIPVPPWTLQLSVYFYSNMKGVSRFYSATRISTTFSTFGSTFSSFKYCSVCAYTWGRWSHCSGVICSIPRWTLNLK